MNLRLPLASCEDHFRVGCDRSSSGGEEKFAEYESQGFVKEVSTQNVLAVDK